MDGDAMIGQSRIDIMNGLRHHASSNASGIFMLIIVVALSGVIESCTRRERIFGGHFDIPVKELYNGRLSDTAVMLLFTLIAARLFQLGSGD
jgi:hypothetical protein